jgi:hypothetical protein
MNALRAHDRRYDFAGLSPRREPSPCPFLAEGRGDIRLLHHERANPDRPWNVILSEAKNLGPIPG